MKVDLVSTNKAIIQVPEYAIAGIIGKGGKHIGDIEKELGISIDIQELTTHSGEKKFKKGKGRKGRRR